MWIPVGEPGEFCPKSDEFFNLASLIYKLKLPSCTKLKAVLMNDMNTPIRL